MPNATTSSRLSGDHGEREENRYLDPASERYATQLAAVIFGWGPWSLDAADDQSVVESSRGTEVSARSRMDSGEVWEAAMAEAYVKSA